MRASVPRSRMTSAEFIDWARRQPSGRYELVGGGSSNKSLIDYLDEQVQYQIGKSLAVKDSTGAVNIPVICTGGFQTASVIRQAIESGACDAVSIARPLVEPVASTSNERRAFSTASADRRFSSKNV